MSGPGVGAAGEARRQAAWVALSGLFLDTTLDERDIAAIARELAQTGYGVDELERIYEEEVAPVCHRNAAALPGGVWTGFDREWLLGGIARHLAQPGILMGWAPYRQWQIRRWTQLTRDDWQRVAALLRARSAAGAPTTP